MLFTFCKNFDGRDTTNDTMDVTTASMPDIYIFKYNTDVHIWTNLKKFTIIGYMHSC